MIEFISLFFIFIGVLLLTYFVTKKIANIKQLTGHAKNMKVIEVLQVGPSQYLYIVEITGAYHLFTATKERLEYCKPLDKVNVTKQEDRPKSFNDYLSYFKDEDKENTCDK